MDIIHVYPYLNTYDRARISKIDKRYSFFSIDDYVFDKIWKNEILEGFELIYFKCPTLYKSAKKHPKYIIPSVITNGKSKILRWMLDKGEIMDTNIKTIVKKTVDGKFHDEFSKEITHCLFDFEIWYPSFAY